MEVLYLEISNEDKDTFIGEFKHLFNPFGAYGGENVAMAAKAALMTIEDRKNYLINSVHCYYVRAGKKGQVSYHVNRVKDGQTFCFRNVVGTQNNKPIITCLVSFKSIDNNQTSDLLHNKYPMPLAGQELDKSVPSLSNTSSHFVVSEPQTSLQIHRLGLPFWLLSEDEDHSLKDPKHLLWMKPPNPLHSAADQNDHRLAVLYASDYHINQVIFYKYPKYQTNFHTSLDHTVHFHSNHIDFNDWHLSDLECVCFGDELTLNTSRIYNRNGDSVASATQQGYIRMKAKL